jgi:hypothetical protein
VHSPDLQPSDYDLFDPVKDALSGRHFADDKGMKQSFVIYSEVEAENFASLVYSVLLNVGKSVLKMMETSWKNDFIIAKDACIIRVNFVVIAATFCDKNLRRYLSPASCILSL